MTKIFVIEDGGVPIPETVEDLRRFADGDAFVHYLGMLMPPRPGVIECITLLEHRDFPPGTSRNELYLLRHIVWADMLWSLVSIPAADKALMERVADECGLRISDGIPTIFSNGRAERFPIDNVRVFTLENKSGHAVYRNDPETTAAIFRAERETVRRIIKKKDG